MIGFTRLLTGGLGGGKTSCGVELIVEHLAAGGYVVTNIKLHLDRIEEYLARVYRVRLDRTRVRIIEGDNLQHFHSHLWRGTAERVVLCVIDEAAISGFNARDHRDMHRDTFEFCTLARKLDVGLYWITQRPHFFDKQLRDLCESITDCRNLKHLRIWGIIPLPIPLLVRVTHHNQGGKFVKSYSELITRKKWVWPLYDSDALLGSSAAKFGALARAEASGLERIPRPPSTTDPLPILASLCAAFFSSF